MLKSILLGDGYFFAVGVRRARKCVEAVSLHEICDIHLVHSRHQTTAAEIEQVWEAYKARKDGEN